MVHTYNSPTSGHVKTRTSSLLAGVGRRRLPPWTAARMCREESLSPVVIMNDRDIQPPMVVIRSIGILLTTSLLLFATHPAAAEPLPAPNEVTNSVESMDEWELPQLPPLKGVYATFYTLGHQGLLGRSKNRRIAGDFLNNMSLLFLSITPTV